MTRIKECVQQRDSSISGSLIQAIPSPSPQEQIGSYVVVIVQFDAMRVSNPVFRGIQLPFPQVQETQYPRLSLLPKPYCSSP